MSFPGGGETVGEAYIRILADGSGLDESIRRQVGEGNKKGWNDAGRQAGKNYGIGFDEELKRPDEARKRRDSVLQQLGRFDATSEKFGGDYGRRLRTSILSGLGQKTKGRDELAERIFGNLKDRAFLAGTTKGVEREMENFSRLRVEAIKQIQNAERTALRDEQRRADIRHRMALSGEQMLKDLLANRNRILERQGLRDTRRDQRLLHERITNARKDLELGYHESSTLLRRSLADFNDHASRNLVKTTGFFRRTLRELTPFEQKSRLLSKHFDDIGNSVGRAFGKGSRNNFVNAIGSIVGAVSRLGLGLIPKIGAALGELAGEFGHANRNSRGFFGTLAAFGGVIAQNTEQALGALIKSVASAGAGLLGFFFIAGPLAAAVSSLTAAVVALAGSISFALVGALGALLPLILPIVAGIGTMVLAFQGLSKAQKDVLKSDIRPLFKFVAAAKTVIRKNLFTELRKDAKLIGPTLNKEVVPILGLAAKAIGKVGGGFARVVASPSFRYFLQSLRDFIPRSIALLGSAFNHFFSGMAGLFRALEPFTIRLLGRIESLAKRFDTFANSVHGQNQIARFMDKAWESAGKLWHTLRSLFHVFGDLASQGRGAGNGLLDSINSSLDRFDRFLDSAKGQRAVRGWFEDMKRFFSALGVFVQGIGKLFSALDSPAGHRALEAILKGLGKFAGFMAKLLPQVLDMAKTALPALATGFAVVFFWVKPLFSFLKAHENVAKVLAVGLVALYASLKLLRLVSTAGIFLGPLFSGIAGLGAMLARTTLGTQIGVWALNAQAAMGRATAGINRTALRLGTAVAGIGLALGGVAAGRSVGGTKGKVIGAASGALGGALVGSAIAPGVGTAIGAVVGGLAGLALSWGHTAKKADNSAERMRAATAKVRAEIEALGAAIDADGNKFGALTSAAVAGRLQKAGALDQAGQLNIDPKLLVQAAEGNQKALDSITAAALSAPTAPLRAMGQALLATLHQLNPQLVTAALETDQVAAAQGKLNLAGRSVAAQFGVVGGAFNKANLSLDQNTKAGRDNLKFQNDHLAALGKAVRAGKLTTTGYYAQINALSKQLEQYGFSTDAITKYVGALQKIPTKVLTQVLKAGVTPEQIQEIVGKYGKIPKGLLTQLTKKGVKPSDIQAILDKYFALPAHRDTEVKAIDHATGTIGGIQAHLDRLGDRTLFINATTNFPGGLQKLSGISKFFTARGGIFHGAQPRIIGEAGPEAVVPLRRPLSQVDPSVRALSAFAQGLDNGSQQKMASGGVVSADRTLTIESGAFQIVTPTTDPEAVAAEVFNRIAAGGYS